MSLQEQRKQANKIAVEILACRDVLIYGAGGCKAFAGQ